MKTRKYLRCPACNRKGVYFKFAHLSSEDGWACRYYSRGCNFYAFTNGTSPVDVQWLKELRELNPEESERI